MGFYPSANSEYSQEKQLEFGREHSGVIGSCDIKFMVGLSSVGNGLLPILRFSFRHIFLGAKTKVPHRSVVDHDRTENLATAASTADGATVGS